LLQNDVVLIGPTKHLDQKFTIGGALIGSRVWKTKPVNHVHVAFEVLSERKEKKVLSEKEEKKK
jgi:hypothetical protein